LGATRFRRQPLLQGDERRMNAQLQHGVDGAPSLELEILEAVKVPRIDDDGLLADDMSADPQREADVRVVQIVRRADADVVDAIRFRSAAQLLEMAIESLDLGEEPHVERVS